MSGAKVGTDAVTEQKEDPETLVLRGRPRPPVRFRRGLIIGLAAGVAASVCGLAWVALEPPSHEPQRASDNEQSPATSVDAALPDMPKSYGDVPRLGPPLPGDLGPPILDHERSLAVAGSMLPAEPAAVPDTERQRLAAEQLATRSSAVLVELHGSSAGSGAPPVVPPQPPGSVDAAADSPNPMLAASQSEKIEFARSSNGELGTSSVRPAKSPWLLSAGTVIPASLITGINSDLPGMVLAQVTENVRDSATGSAILVPQGARLIGAYDSRIAYGERRALVVWKRIIFPDGSSIALDNVPATDAAGYAGVSDSVDSHSWPLLKGIVLSTLLGVGTQLSFGGTQHDLVGAIRESAQQNAASAGDRITNRNLEVQPTLTVRPGWPIWAVLNKDLVIQPWKR